jgi:hypothetical protein
MRNSFVVLSNVFYLIPLYISYMYSIWPVTTVLAGLVLSSLTFHLYKTAYFSVLDTTCSYATVFVCLILIIYGENIFVFETIILVVLGLITRFYIEDGSRDDVAHGFWHIVASLTISLCILGFVK